MSTVIIGKRIVRMDKNTYVLFLNGCGRKRILEKLMCRSCGLYLTTIRIIESNKVLEMISWILTHIGFDTTIWDIQVVI